MRTLGLFRELDSRRPDVFRESLVEAVQSSPGEHEDKIAIYLDSGVPVVDIMESTPDVIGGEAYVSGGSSVLTDGIWVWRQDLSYYVRNYHLALDRDFLTHVVEVDFSIPELDQSSLLALADAVLREVLDMS